MALRKAARRFGVSLCTVQRWVERAQGQRLDRVDWSDLTHRPRRTTRVSRRVEDQVLAARSRLRDESALGHYGADAILEALRQVGVDPVPSRSTIARILRRREALTTRKRTRRPPPPRGWYLLPVACGKAELDSFDFIEGLKIRGGPCIDVLTGISLHGGLPAAFPVLRRTTTGVCEAVVRHWREHGLPDYAQFDNDTVFHGGHRYANAIGRVTRLCLSLGVVAVFAVPREHGPQNPVEGFNGRWQTKVWRRFHWTSLSELCLGSDRYLAAVRQYRASRIQQAPARRPFPADWTFEVDAPLRGMIIFLRRLDDQGRASLLGQKFPVSPAWAHRLVRAEVRLDARQIAFFGLSRRQTTRQPRLATSRYRFPQKPFRSRP